MEEFAKLLSAFATLLWPLALGVLLFKLYQPIYKLVDSARGRRFTLKVAGNELTMDEADAQQRVILSDLQNKVAELEKRLATAPQLGALPQGAAPPSDKRILWVDDQPKNNSYLIQTLLEREVKIDIALSTDEGIAKFKKQPYDIVVSDMARPESDRAGIDLAKHIHKLRPGTPVFIFCGSWAARTLRQAALDAGVTEITASGTTLLSALPLTSAP